MVELEGRMINRLVFALAIPLSLCGMEFQNALQDKDLAERFRIAIDNEKLDEIKELIKQGANAYCGKGYASPPLHIASFRGSPDLCRLFIEAGADEGLIHEGKTPLMKAVAMIGHNRLNVQNLFDQERKREQQFDDTVFVLLTTIPLREKNKIKQVGAAIITALLIFKKMNMPKDVRRVIAQLVIELLIREQMDRIKDLIELSSLGGAFKGVVRDLAIQRKRPMIATLLDLTNAASHAKIRNQIKANLLPLLVDNVQNDPIKKHVLKNSLPRNYCGVIGLIKRLFSR